MYILFLIPLLFMCGCGVKESLIVQAPSEVQIQALPVVVPVLLEAKYADLPVPVGFSVQPSNGPFFYTGTLPLELVRDFYHKQMERFGWVLEDYSLGAEGLLVCRKPSRNCIISIRTAGSSTQIVLFTQQVDAPEIAVDINNKPVPGEKE